MTTQLMPNHPSPLSPEESMETLVDAIARLRAANYRCNLSATPGGNVRCLQCRRETEPGELVVDEIVRFEGCSDPADQAVLYALTGQGGSVRGLYVAGYGPEASAEDIEVASLLPRW